MKRFTATVLIAGLGLSGLGIIIWAKGQDRQKLETSGLGPEPATVEAQKRVVSSHTSPESGSIGPRPEPPVTINEDAQQKLFEDYQEDLKQAITWYQNGDIDQAIAQLLILVEKQPNRDDAHALLGELYQDKNDYARAYTHLREALEVNGKNSRALLAIAEVLEHPIPGQPLARKYTYDFFKEMEMEQSSPALQLGLGKMDLGDKNIDSAMARFQQASQNPEYMVAATLEAGTAFVKLGETDRALQFYKMKIDEHKSQNQKLPPDWEDLRLNYANTLVDLKRYDEAQKQLQELEFEVPGADTAWLYERLNKERGS
jgi:tetratricopeptide (TPR) repeat protein